MRMGRKLREVAEHLGVHLVGDGEREVMGVASFRNASSTDLVFVEDERHFQEALDSKAAAVIAGKFALTASCARSLLFPISRSWYSYVRQDFWQQAQIRNRESILQLSFTRAPKLVLVP